MVKPIPILSPNDVLMKGLHFLVGVRIVSKRTTNTLNFHKHYGSSPLDLADQWYDLTITFMGELTLSDKDKTWQAFRMYMIAHYYLWSYDKNAHLVASRFGIAESFCRGEPLWIWIKRIARLREKKIVWDPSLALESTEVLGITIDGVDMKTWEKSTENLNVDSKTYSKKFAHGALKYEIALAVNRSKCVHLAGPYRGGMHDLTMF